MISCSLAHAPKSAYILRKSLCKMKGTMPCNIAPVVNLFRYPLNTRYRTNDVMRKDIAANDVYLLSIASMVLPLCFPKKVSAPPAMDPERPAVLPDWSRTITIIETANNM